MNRSNYNIYIIFGLMLIYYLQGVLYTSGSVLAQTALLAYLIISSIYFTKTIMLSRKSDISNVLIMLILVLGFYMLISVKEQVNAMGEVNSIDTYKFMCIALLSFFPFYYLARSKSLNNRHMLILFIAFTIVCILRFYNDKTLIMQRFEIDNGGIVNNQAYSFVMLLPYIGLFANRRNVSIIAMLVSVFFIIIGAKRGAVISGFAGVAIYFYYWFNDLKQRGKASNIILFILLVFISISVIYYFLNKDVFLLERFTLLSDGNSSGRDLIYAIIWNYWLTSNSIFHMLFGFGFNASIDITGGSFAHNDWLELLSSTGLFGVGIYLAFFISLWKFAHRSYLDIYDRTMLMMIFAIWSLTTLFSMMYSSDITFLITALIGYIIGKNEVKISQL